jgi:hypothetical protein
MFNVHQNNHRPRIYKLMKNIIVFSVVLSLSSTIFSGCATIFKGGDSTVKLIGASDDVQVETKDGVKIPVSKDGSDKVIKLPSKNEYVLTIKYNGKEQKISLSPSVGAGWVILDLLLGGLIAIVIDAATGHWNGLPDITLQ